MNLKKFPNQKFQQKFVFFFLLLGLDWILVDFAEFSIEPRGSECGELSRAAELEDVVFASQLGVSPQQNTLTRDFVSALYFVY